MIPIRKTAVQVTGFVTLFASVPHQIAVRAAQQ